MWCSTLHTCWTKAIWWNFEGFLPLFTNRADALPQDLTKTRYREIRVWTFQSLPNLTSTSTAALPTGPSFIRAIRPLLHPNSMLRGFMRSCGKTSVRLVNRGPRSILICVQDLRFRILFSNSSIYDYICCYCLENWHWPIIICSNQWLDRGRMIFCNCSLNALCDTMNHFYDSARVNGRWWKFLPKCKMKPFFQLEFSWILTHWCPGKWHSNASAK